MAPENEGKPAVGSMGGRTEVSVDELLEIEQLMVKVQVQMEGICSSDLSFQGDLKHDSLDLGNAQVNYRPEVLKVLANKSDNVKICNELALLKLRNLIPRQKGSGEEVSSNMNLKRSRPLSPLHVPRVPSMALESKVGLLPDAAASSPRGIHAANNPFDIPSPTPGEMVPLKFIRTGDNTKAPFQKPSTIFMPTAKLGSVGVPILDLPIVPVPTTEALPAPAPAMMNKVPSPKKRPSRSRRERNRTRNKVVVLPEPVMQRLQPGDTNKIPEDGYLWRKYGNKPIKTASYKRGYYKCRHFKEVKCNATKIVQQTNNDPNTFSVHYKGEHTCTQRGNMGVNGGPQNGGHDSASLADQVNENMHLGDPRSPDEEKDDGIEWAEDNDSVSDSEDVFPAEGGEEAVESITPPPAAAAAPAAAADELPQPASPLISFEMPSIGSMPNDSLPSDMSGLPSDMSEITVDTASPWVDTLSAGGDFKVKYEDTCTTDSQEIDQNGLLLDLIHGGLMGDNPIHDINYWCQDLDSFAHFPSDSQLF